MRIAVLAGFEQRKDWERSFSHLQDQINWVENESALYFAKADAYFDLDFENRIDSTKLPGEKPIFICSVIKTLADLKISNSNIYRLNAWPGFINSKLLELAAQENSNKDDLKKLTGNLQIGFKIIPDVPGMVTPRIVAMIINEAYFALNEGVGTKGNIDFAMKTGTNYPYGPFEWAEKIGLKKVLSLLQNLALSDERYNPARNLLEEAERLNN